MLLLLQAGLTEIFFVGRGLGWVVIGGSALTIFWDFRVGAYSKVCEKIWCVRSCLIAHVPEYK